MIYTIFSISDIKNELLDQRLTVPVPADFYLRDENSGNPNMYTDMKTMALIEDFFKRYRSKLSLIRKIKNRFLPNNVLLLVDKSIEHIVTARILYDYTICAFDCLNISILEHPDSFKEEDLKKLETIKHKVLNKGKFNCDIPIKQLKKN